MDVDGTVSKPYGDNPDGYLMYMPDGHMSVLFAARERTQLFGTAPGRGFVLIETAQPNTPLGFVGYSGTFEVHDREVIHRTQFHVIPSLNGRVGTRSVRLDGDRLILGTPRSSRLEWQR
jgi:hypothetical protein